MKPAERGTPAPRRWAEHTVAEHEAGRTVQEILTGTMGISRRMIQRLTRAKGILVNRKAAFLARALRPGDVVAARLAEHEEYGVEPARVELAVLHEDRDVLVINKAAGVLVHPTSPEHTHTLAHGIAYHFQQQEIAVRVRPVHRIDRDTSGLLLVAKSAFAHQHLDRQLRERTLSREYLAVARGRVRDDDGIIEAAIGRHPRNSNLRAVNPAGDPARTRFRVRERFAEATLLELELDTGRTHQIRVHLAHLNHPVLGDRPYGGAAPALIRRQALHAWRLRFVHPATGERMLIEAPLPHDMESLLAELRAGAA